MFFSQKMVKIQIKTNKMFPKEPGKGQNEFPTNLYVQEYIEIYDITLNRKFGRIGVKSSINPYFEPFEDQNDLF